jgi:hypothetical protein
MIRTGVISALLLLAGCGAIVSQRTPTAGSARQPSSRQDPRPVAAPPRRPDPSAPPPAWVHTSSRSRWLAFGSYCWSATRGRAACVDMIAPDQRGDVPILVVRPGEVLRFDLAFTAKSLDIYVGLGTHSTLHRRDARAVAWRAPSGRGDQLATLDVEAQAARGSASYLARIRVR